MEYERANKANRHRNGPHRKTVQNQAPFCVTARTENTANQNSVNRRPEKRDTVDIQKRSKEIRSLFVQVCNSEKQRTAQSQNHRAHKSRQNRAPDKPRSIPVGKLHLIRTNLLSKQNRATVSHSKAKNARQISHDAYNRIRRDQIRAKMPHNHGIHRPARAPDSLVSNRRNRIFDKILQ